MPNLPTITKPSAGEETSKLWQHVARLVDRVNALSAQVDAIASKSSPRRPMDVSAGAGATYRGEFGPGLSYKVGDIVRVTSGPMAGVWGCVKAYNGATTEHNPVFPEPEDHGDVYWELMNFGPKLMSYFQNGVHTFYVQSSDPTI